MTGAYAHDWPGRAVRTDDGGRGCGPDGHGGHGHDGPRHGGHDGPRHGGRGGHGHGRGGHGHGRGGRGPEGGRFGRGEGPGLTIEALAGWMMSRGGRGHGPGRGRPDPEDLEKLEAIMALRGMRGRGFGGGGRGPRGRGRRRRGDVRLAVLRLLAEEPRNGYQLMQTIEERSGGQWRPSPGSMYPTLSQLQDEELIRSTEVDGGRRFEITDGGRSAVAERAGEPDPWQSEPDADEHAMSELGPLVIGIGRATWQVAAVADDAQRAQAAELLAETRRRLYAILAQETTDTGDAAADPDARSGADDGPRN